MAKGKPFFFRIDAGALLNFATEPDGEKVTLFQFAKDLCRGESKVPFIQDVISEATDFMEKKSSAGQKGMEKRWGKKDNTDITVLSSVITELGSVITVLSPESDKNDNTDITRSSSSSSSSNKKKKEDDVPYEQIVNDMNLALGKSYKHGTQAIRKLISARFKEGFTAEDFAMVVRGRKALWKGDPKMEQYLRPETMFGEKFNTYLIDASKPSQPALFSVTKAQAIATMTDEEIKIKATREYNNGTIHDLDYGISTLTRQRERARTESRASA